MNGHTVKYEKNTWFVCNSMENGPVDGAKPYLLHKSHPFIQEHNKKQFDGSSFMFVCLLACLFVYLIDERKEWFVVKKIKTKTKQKNQSQS